ncbi:MAG: AAA family ATPase, partial [Chloroflexota bacterium]|nr:AAA family ATPase [Chloroflexota bacterium]
SNDEIDAYLGSDQANEPGADTSISSEAPERVKMSQLEKEISAKEMASLDSGISLRLSRLVKEFGLNSFEKDVLLICLLPEIDTRYERIYAYINDDVTRKRPSVNLVVRCLLDDAESRLSAREAFLRRSPLLLNRLIYIENEFDSKAPSLLTRDIRIDQRVANYLLGSDQLDTHLESCAQLIIPSVEKNALVLSVEAMHEFEQLAQNMATSVPGVLYLHGDSGVGKKVLAEALCYRWNLPALLVNVGNILVSDISTEAMVKLAFREAILQGAVLCWEQFDLLFSEDRATKTAMEEIINGIVEFSGLTLVMGEADWQPGSMFDGRPYFRMNINTPEYTERRRLWNMYLNGNSPAISAEDLEELADKFRFSPRQIRNAAATARNLAVSRGDSEISIKDLYSACRATSNQRLTLFARKIQPKYTWDDIVLPRDQMAQLREITNYVRYRHVVYSDWNFERRISLGKGLNVLFAGPSGTGKTMAAEILANELGLDLYKIDLSTVVSKYIGETEKNLDRIFSEAWNSNSILFFDEADAIFGKRSEVRDSHDRYANIEVAYLLQKMEEYDGIVILATNLKKNLDDAFARRMHFNLEFPQPDETDRLLIWRAVFPAEAPQDGSLDLNFMARQFKITGGNIKNIAVGAAFLAVADCGEIQTEHLIRATKREYQKMGRLCTETDFGPYYELVRG